MKIRLWIGVVVSLLIVEQISAAPCPCSVCAGNGGQDICSCTEQVVRPPPPQILPRPCSHAPAPQYQPPQYQQPQGPTYTQPPAPEYKLPQLPQLPPLPTCSCQKTYARRSATCLEPGAPLGILGLRNLLLPAQPPPPTDEQVDDIVNYYQQQLGGGAEAAALVNYFHQQMEPGETQEERRRRTASEHQPPGTGRAVDVTPEERRTRAASEHQPPAARTRRAADEEHQGEKRQVYEYDSPPPAMVRPREMLPIDPVSRTLAKMMAKKAQQNVKDGLLAYGAVNPIDGAIIKKTLDVNEEGLHDYVRAVFQLHAPAQSDDVYAQPSQQLPYQRPDSYQDFGYGPVANKEPEFFRQGQLAPDPQSQGYPGYSNSQPQQPQEYNNPPVQSQGYDNSPHQQPQEYNSPPQQPQEYNSPPVQPQYINSQPQESYGNQPQVYPDSGPMQQGPMYRQYRQSEDEPQSQDPEPQSQDPEPQSQDPEFQSQDPQFQSQDPEFLSQDPQFQSQDPQFQSQDPQFQSQDPEFQSQDPQFQSQDPEPQSQYPQFQSQDREFQSQDPEFQTNQNTLQQESNGQNQDDADSQNYGENPQQNQQVIYEPNVYDDQNMQQPEVEATEEHKPEVAEQNGETEKAEETSSPLLQLNFKDILEKMKTLTTTLNKKPFFQGKKY